VSCRVAVESTTHQHRQGKLYHVRISLTVPGGRAGCLPTPRR
jgi:hypothetical protein